MTTSSSSASDWLEQPTPDDRPVFQAPWEARAFALVNQLATDDRYSWTEWTDYLVHEISTTEKASPGVKSYYEQWLDAYEKLLVAKGLLTSTEIQAKISELVSEREAEHQH